MLIYREKKESNWENWNEKNKYRVLIPEPSCSHVYVFAVISFNGLNEVIGRSSPGGKHHWFYSLVGGVNLWGD